eukprot:1306422-Alexandrium_andersonii.AAC.1
MPPWTSRWSSTSTLHGCWTASPTSCTTGLRSGRTTGTCGCASRRQLRASAIAAAARLEEGQGPHHGPG